MPKRGDVRTAMVVGSGPIVIGQAAEFDYSGTQACRSLREEGVRVVLVNSNPATIQTDPETADAVYVEPLTIEFLEKVIAKERPQGILSGMGGQTALNLCSELADAGILQRHGVELLGTKLEAITAGENRERFASLMRSIGEPIPRSRAASDFESARVFVEEIGYPAIVRARIEGDRLSHRTHRRQDRDRSPPRRDPEPGHRENAGFLRAHPRLRRHEDSPMAVRQIPDGRPAHWHVDEKHRGSHGDRPDVRGVLPEGRALPRD